VIENRGRAPSPVSEVQVCYTSAYDNEGRCGERVEQFDLPALGAGETAEVTRPLRLKAYGTQDDFRLSAVLDPDNSTVQTNRANDAAVSRASVLDAPQLQWMGFRAPEAIRQGDDVVVEFRLRNRSFAATSSPTEIEWGGNYWGNKPETRTPIPALAPRQTYVARVRLRPELYDVFALHGVIDRDGKSVWGSAHERQKGQDVRVIAR
jgi:hypothetical protein